MSRLRAAALAVMLAPGSALGTAGYFQLGYGLKAKGMAGVGIALPQDASAAAINPAGMVRVGSRVDAGADWFVADRGSEITGNTLGLSGSRDANGRRGFLVPDFGINRMLDARRSIGLSAYGNGGVTRYAHNPLGALDGTSPAGMALYQVVLAPTFAANLDARHALGIALNFVGQQFEARGFEHFDDPVFSESPGDVTNRGRDHSHGWGWRAGWLGQLSPGLSLGATYQPKIHMSKFGRYKGLLAGQGNFDVPENYGVGIALQATSALLLAADAQRIEFAGVTSLGARADCFLATSCLLGAGDGPGSGWRSTTVYKLGLAYRASSALTLRGGFATLRQPIPEDQTLLNVFAPAVSERHLTLGATWRAAEQLELTLAYMRAFENTVYGRGSVPAGRPPRGVGGGEANLRMRQEALGISLGWLM
jgi:long-chain fatty acid transport protein